MYRETKVRAAAHLIELLAHKWSTCPFILRLSAFSPRKDAHKVVHRPAVKVICKASVPIVLENNEQVQASAHPHTAWQTVINLVHLAAVNYFTASRHSKGQR